MLKIKSIQQRDLLNLQIDETNLQTIENDFLRIANEILNNYILHVDKEKYRILNIEFYFYNHTNHKDYNSHALKYKRAKERLMLSGKWYLHKMSINLKYTYKGLDYTFGNGKIYGGILIKEAMNIKTKKIFSQSNFVNELISVLKPFSKESFLNIVENSNKIKFEQESLKQFDIQKSKRKGLVKNSFRDSEYAFKIKIL